MDVCVCRQMKRKVEVVLGGGGDGREMGDVDVVTSAAQPSYIVT